MKASPRPVAATGRIRLRESTPIDVDYVLDAEADPDTAPYIIRWSRDQHLDAMADEDRGHWIVENRVDGTVCGYVILSALNSPHGSIEFNRITITDKGRGYGRECLRLVKDVVFGELGAHRLWLDVMTHNRRAHALYRSEGFTEEGCLREALLIDGRRASLVVLAMLRHEYENLIGKQLKPDS